MKVSAWVSGQRRERIVLAFVLALAAIFGIGAQAQARDLGAITPKLKCEELQGKIFHAGDDLAEITSAKINVDNPSAPACEVMGYVAPQVQFGMKLPLTTWHQRLVFLGCGGFCGGVQTRPWAVAHCGAFDNGELALIYSDLGHESAHSDAVWASANNAQNILDLGSRGVHVSNLAAREIISMFYGQAPAFSYFNGCSDGGREALMSAQRYPGDFDGIVAGAPAANLTMNNSVYHAWFVQHLLAPDKKILLDDAQLAAIRAEVLRQCDALDGKSDGAIADPTKCHPTLDRLECTAANTPGCLTSQQIAMVLAIYAGPKDAKGHDIYHGVVPGSEWSWSRQISGSADFAMTFTSFMTGAEPAMQQDVWKLDYSPASLKRYNHYAAELNALDPDLTAFQAGGRKILVWHGSADSSIPPGSTIDYVSAVRGKLGVAKTNAFLRFYLVPGMGHCMPGGGSGPAAINFLDPLMQWVEDGVAPKTITAWGAPGSPDWAMEPYFKP